VFTKPIILCDLDGTLADCQHRIHHITPPQYPHGDGKQVHPAKDWAAFFAACANRSAKMLSDKRSAYASQFARCGALIHDTPSLLKPNAGLGEPPLYSANIIVPIECAADGGLSGRRFDWVEMLAVWADHPARSANTRVLPGRASRSSPVAAPLLPPQPHFQSLACRSCIRMKVKSPPTQRADPTPLPHKGRVAQQRRLDCQHVEASQIAMTIASLQHNYLEIAGFLSHASIVRHFLMKRPTQRLNQRPSTDS
jgi:hypothetical protein